MLMGSSSLWCLQSIAQKDSSGDLVKVEQEMSMMMKGDKVAKNDEVMIG